MGADQTSIRRQSNSICLAFICYAVAGRLFGMGFNLAVGSIGHPSETLIQILMLASYMLAICVPMLLLAKGTPIKEYAAVPAQPIVLKGIGLFFGSYFAVVILNTAASGLLELAGFAVRAAEAAFPKAPVAIIVYALRCTLFPAFLEEILFRGLLLSRLRVFGDRFGIIVSALLFAAVHLDVTQFAGIFLMAVLFGWLMVESKSILPGIVLHFLNNALALTFIYLRTVFPAHTYQTLLTVVFLLCGITALVVFVISILHRPHVLLGARTNPFRFFKSVPAVIMILLFITLFLERIEVAK